MYRERETFGTANLRTKITDCRGFYSSIILMLRGGIPRPIGNFSESLSQAILVGIILVGRLGIAAVVVDLNSLVPSIEEAASLSFHIIVISLYVQMFSVTLHTLM